MKFKLPLTHPLHLVLGLVIWSIWLVAVYAGLSLGCMIAPEPEMLGPGSWINMTLLLFTLLTTALLLWLAVRCWRHPVPADNNPGQSRFTLRVSAAVYLAGAITTCAAGLPILRLPPCL